MSADRGPWWDCVRCCKADDTVVLLDAAVMRLTAESEQSLSEFPCLIVASGPDAEARIGPVIRDQNGIRLISDGDLIRLMKAHPHCLSWR